MSFIKAKDLDLVFSAADGDVHALSKINIVIEKGEFVSFIGPSGCGKTTLLRVIADLVKPTSGEISIRGKLPSVARMNREYGYIFQSPALYPWRTVEKNIHLPLEIFGVPKKERVERTQRVLKMVHLEGFEKKYPWQLSGGMQQRVSIARAFSFEADLLLMDEPFGALDEITRENLNQQLYELWVSTQKTMIFVTHSIAEAVFLSTKIVVFSPRPGRIVDIKSGLKRERNEDIRGSKEFLELSQQIRKALHSVSSNSL